MPKSIEFRFKRVAVLRLLSWFHCGRIRKPKGRGGLGDLSIDVLAAPCTGVWFRTKGWQQTQRKFPVEKATLLASRIAASGSIKVNLIAGPFFSLSFACALFSFPFPSFSFPFLKTLHNRSFHDGLGSDVAKSPPKKLPLRFSDTQQQLLLDPLTVDLWSCT